MGSTGRTWRKLYKTQRWARLRRQQLDRHPLCQCPHHKGKDPSATADVVDHITPHRGDRTLFFDRANLQSMTKECHDRFAQSRDKGGPGFLRGCDVNGNPLSEEHSWHAS